MGASHVVKLKRREAAAEETVSIYLERPEGFGFQAGQCIDLSLALDPDLDPKESTRSFSIASAPFEEDLMVTTCLRDSTFKQTLRELPSTLTGTIEGPCGSFTLRENQSRPLVLIAEGVVITPFRSILKQAERHSSLDDVDLFYANRNPESAAFLEELSGIEPDSGKFRLVAAMTGPGASEGGWRGETGRIDAEMLARYVVDPAAATYYIAGPPAMVKASRELLSQIGTEPENIRFESFKGYGS